MSLLFESVDAALSLPTRLLPGAVRASLPAFLQPSPPAQYEPYYAAPVKKRQPLSDRQRAARAERRAHEGRCAPAVPETGYSKGPSPPPPQPAFSQSGDSLAYRTARRAALLLLPSSVQSAASSVLSAAGSAASSFRSIAGLLESTAARFGLTRDFVLRHRAVFALCLAALCLMLVFATWGILVVVGVMVGVGGIAWLAIAV